MPRKGGSSGKSDDKDFMKHSDVIESIDHWDVRNHGTQICWVAIKSNDNKFLRATKDGNVLADSSYITNECIFEFTPLSYINNEKFVIRSYVYSRYCSVDPNKNILRCNKENFKTDNEKFCIQYSLNLLSDRYYIKNLSGLNQFLSAQQNLRYEIGINAWLPFGQEKWNIFKLKVSQEENSGSGTPNKVKNENNDKNEKFESKDNGDEDDESKSQYEKDILASLNFELNKKLSEKENECNSEYKLFEKRMKLFNKYVIDNNKALTIYRQSIDNGDKKIASLSDWMSIYNRILKKNSEWKQYQSEINNSFPMKSIKYKGVYYTSQAVPPSPGNSFVVSNNNPNNNSNNEEKNDSKNSNNNQKKKVIDRSSMSYWDEIQLQKEYIASQLEFTQQTQVTTLNNRANLLEASKQTENQINTCNNEIDQIDKEIEALMNKKKQIIIDKKKYQTRLTDQKKLIIDTQFVNQELALQSQLYNRQIFCLQESNDIIDEFDNNMKQINNILDKEFVRLLKLWRVWQAQEINAFFKRILIGRFNNDNNNSNNNENNVNAISTMLNEYQTLFDGVSKSGMRGKDLANINDLILRSFGLNDSNDRQFIVTNINHLVNGDFNEIEGCNNVLFLKKKKNESDKEKNKDKMKNDKNFGSSECVVCLDGDATMICIPCGHIAICETCKPDVFESGKCAYCSQPITQILKSYTVGA